MGIRSLLPSSMVVGAKKIMKRKHNHYQQQQHYSQHSFPLSTNAHHTEVPKGHFAVYLLGDDHHNHQQQHRRNETTMKRFVVPISFLNHPMFGELLDMAEAEFGFHHSMGALTLPCDEDSFLHLISSPAF